MIWSVFSNLLQPLISRFVSTIGMAIFNNNTIGDWNDENTFVQIRCPHRPHTIVRILLKPLKFFRNMSMNSTHPRRLGWGRWEILWINFRFDDSNNDNPNHLCWLYVQYSRPPPPFPFPWNVEQWQIINKFRTEWAHLKNNWNFPVSISHRTLIKRRKSSPILTDGLEIVKFFIMEGQR